jgi:small-conductance mechanosensitive channel
MDIYLESFQIDPRQLDLTDEERQRLEAMANQPDPKEIVAQIQAETDLMIAKIRDATERMKLSVSAQLDGAQIDQARDAVETQTAAQIAGQVIKGEDDLTKEKVKQGAKPPPTNGAQAPAAAPPEMNVDDALSTLGIV